MLEGRVTVSTMACRLSIFTDAILDTLAANDEGESIIGILHRIQDELAPPHIRELRMDRVPANNTELQVLDAFATETNIYTLAFCETLDASAVPDLLDRYIRKGGRARVAYFKHIQMNATQFEDIMLQVRNHGIPNWMTVCRKQYADDGVYDVFCGHIQESSSALSLSLGGSPKEHPNEYIPEDSFCALCSAIGDSPSIQTVVLCSLVFKDANIKRVTTILVDAIVKCPTITMLHHGENESCTFSADRVYNALCGTDAVNTSNLVIRRRKKATGDVFRFRRQCWWKELLSRDDVSLELWPCILKDADDWTSEDSHSHLDILNFLVKEKSTILLQNVGRRRSRKRKRYGHDA